MTPVEKALELVEKFYAIEDSKENYDAWMDWYLAIRSAQVAVDEIFDIAYWQLYESGGEQEEKYWQEVKHEIEYMYTKQLPK